MERTFPPWRRSRGPCPCPCQSVLRVGEVGRPWRVSMRRIEQAVRRWTTSIGSIYRRSHAARIPSDSGLKVRHLSRISCRAGRTRAVPSLLPYITIRDPLLRVHLRCSADHKAHHVARWPTRHSHRTPDIRVRPAHLTRDAPRLTSWQLIRNRSEIPAVLHLCMDSTRRNGHPRFGPVPCSIIRERILAQGILDQ